VHRIQRSAPTSKRRLAPRRAAPTASSCSGGSWSGGAGRQGFTLIEVLIVLTIVLTLAVLVLPTFRAVLHRTKIVGFAQQVSVILQQARLEAIKQGAPVTVGLSSATLVSTSSSSGSTLAQIITPAQISLEASRGFGGTDAVGFQSDGSVDNTGAFRIADSWGNQMEVAVEPQGTARVEIRKKDGSGVYNTEGTGGTAWTFQ
jgi:prepilin-type N-terminal cleavage/methylation domain-containing protein